MVLAIAALFVASVKPVFFTDSGNFQNVEVSRDTRTGVTIDASGWVRIWRFPAGRRVTAKLSNSFFLPPASSGSVPRGRRAVYFSLSPDGHRLAVQTEDGKLTIWKLNPVGVVRSRQLPRGAESIMWTPDGRDVLLGWTKSWKQGDGYSVLVATDGPIRYLRCTAPWAVSPSGQAIAGLTASGFALFSRRSGQMLRSFKTKVEANGPVAFSPDGKYLVNGSDDPGYVYENPPEGVVLPDGAYYAHSFKVAIWRVRDGRRLAYTEGNEWQDTTSPIRFLSPSRFAVLGSGAIVECPSGTVVRRFELPVFSDADESDGTPPRPTVSLRSSIPGDPGRVAIFPEAARYVNGLVFNPDGSRMAFNLESTLIRLDLKPLKLRSTEKIAFEVNSSPMVYKANGEIYCRSGTATYILKEVAKKDGSVSNGSAVYVSGALSGSGDLSSFIPETNYRAVANIDRRTGKEISRYELGPEHPKTARFYWVALTTDESKVFCFRNSDFGLGNDLDLINSGTGRLEWEIGLYGSEFLPLLSPSGNRVYFIDEYANGAPKLVMVNCQDGSTIATKDVIRGTNNLGFSADGSKLYLRDDAGLAVLDPNSLTSISRTPILTGGPGNSSSLVTFGDRLAEPRWDSVDFTRISDGRPLARLQFYGSRDWVAWTPEGAIAGTPDGISHLFKVTAGRIERCRKPVNPLAVSQAISVGLEEPPVGAISTSSTIKP